jgi:integral membrane protein (TIGR01906 family)
MDKYLKYTFIILLPIFLLLFSLKFVLLTSSLTPAQDNWINYFENKGVMPDGYTEQEQQHMVDVKNIMQKADITFFILLLFLTLILTYYKKEQKTIQKLWQLGGKATLVSIGFFLLLSLLAFNSAFTYFHKIFFPQGNWQFPIDSLLLQTWPLDFFTSISIKILLLTILLGFITIYISKRHFK